MRAFLSLFTAVWSLSLVLCDPLTCTEVVEKVDKGDLGIEVNDLPTIEEGNLTSPLTNVCRT